MMYQKSRMFQLLSWRLKRRVKRRSHQRVRPSYGAINLQRVSQPRRANPQHLLDRPLDTVRGLSSRNLLHRLQAHLYDQIYSPERRNPSLGAIRAPTTVSVRTRLKNDAEVLQYLLITAMQVAGKNHSRPGDTLTKERRGDSADHTKQLVEIKRSGALKRSSKPSPTRPDRRLQSESS